MNGEELRYLEKISDERHTENKETLKTLFSKIDNIHNCIKSFPCKTHTADIKWLTWGFRIMGGLVVAIIVTYIKMR